MSEQGFRGVPVVPEGWEFLGFGVPCVGDHWLDSGLKIRQWTSGIYSAKPIIRKIETPNGYRPFASAEEFNSAHRDRWWHCGLNWEESFEIKLFDDGTPFGVEVTE